MTSTQRASLHDLIEQLRTRCLEEDVMPAIIILFPAREEIPGQTVCGVGTADPGLIRTALVEATFPPTVYGGFLK